MLRFSKQTVAHSGANFGDDVLAELVRNMGSVAGVLHVVPSEFVSRVRFVPDEAEQPEVPRAWHRVRLNDPSLLDVYADYAPQRMFVRLLSKAQAALGSFAIAINRNVLGLAVDGTPAFPEQIEFGEVAEVAVALKCDPAAFGNAEQPEIQIALRTNKITVYAVDRVPAEAATGPEGEIGMEGFRKCFGLFTASASFSIEEAVIADDVHLKEANVFVVGKNANKTYVSFALGQANVFVAEVAQNEKALAVTVKGASNTLFGIIEASARMLFAQK
jgi:hypothetical protein